MIDNQKKEIIAKYRRKIKEKEIKLDPIDIRLKIVKNN